MAKINANDDDATAWLHGCWAARAVASSDVLYCVLQVRMSVVTNLTIEVSQVTIRSDSHCMGRINYEVTVSVGASFQLVLAKLWC